MVSPCGMPLNFFHKRPMGVCKSATCSKRRVMPCAFSFIGLFSFGIKVTTIPKSEEFNICELETLDSIQSV